MDIGMEPGFHKLLLPVAGIDSLWWPSKPWDEETESWGFGNWTLPWLYRSWSILWDWPRSSFLHCYNVLLSGLHNKASFEGQIVNAKRVMTRKIDHTEINLFLRNNVGLYCLFAFMYCILFVKIVTQTKSSFFMMERQITRTLNFPLPTDSWQDPQQYRCVLIIIIFAA